MKLRELRKEKHLTVGDIAQKVGLSVQCIYNYEKGIREPNVTTIYKLAEIFNVPVEMMLAVFREVEEGKK